METTIIMNDKVEKQLKNIISYMKETEVKHYEESDRKGKIGHIFKDVIAVEKWLKEELEEN